MKIWKIFNEKSVGGLMRISPKDDDEEIGGGR